MTQHQTEAHAHSCSGKRKKRSRHGLVRFFPSSLKWFGSRFKDRCVVFLSNISALHLFFLWAPGLKWSFENNPDTFLPYLSHVKKRHFFIWSKSYEDSGSVRFLRDVFAHVLSGSSSSAVFISVYYLVFNLFSDNLLSHIFASPCFSLLNVEVSAQSILCLGPSPLVLAKNV